MKYRRGDVVRVRNDLVVGKKYQGQVFTDRMLHLSGEHVKILVAQDGRYYAEKVNDASSFLERSRFFLTDEMLEDAKRNRCLSLNVGDIVRVREDLERGCSYRMNDESEFSQAYLAVGNMTDLRGTYVTIEEKFERGDFLYYRVSDMNGCRSPFKWTNGMFDDYIIRAESESDAAEAEELCVLYEWIPEVRK